MIGSYAKNQFPPTIGHDPAGLADWTGSIESKFQTVFEACSFQDITGQRITKIVGELKYIDERLSKMIAIWGPKDFRTSPSNRRYT